VIGTLLGAALGSFLCWLQIKYQIISLDPTVYQFAVMPMVLRWQYVLAVSGFAILISFLSTLYPARQAAKMNPAESLRYE
jgi:lipoprotein-releasing system permease protein